MSGPTSSGTWKNFERIVARKDWQSERNPLSGANNKSDSGEGRPGDVILPSYMDVVIECKYKAFHAHHTLLEAAEADAKKHGKKHAILYTKVKRSQGWNVVLNGELWSELVRLPEVQEALRVRS